MLTKKSKAEILLERGVAEFMAGQIVPATETFREAAEANPQDQTAPANMVFVADYGPEIGWEKHQAIRAEWAKKWNGVEWLTYPKDWDPERKLTIGYVSGDFCNHSASHCFGPIVNGHDRENFRVILYSMTQGTPDQYTDEYKAKADAWRYVYDLTDLALAKLIIQDGVDILVDLSGFSGLNRLPCFALKPAPIQVTAWGHGGGTGLKAMDYTFADPVFIPEAARPLLTEKVWDLPCFITYGAPENTAPVLAPPVLRNGYITFGCLNRVQKVDVAVGGLLDTWAAILSRVDNSRLLLKATGWGRRNVQGHVFRALDRHSVQRDRVEFRGEATAQLIHLQAYSEVDIALDTHPQNGGVTTWEALWMGVPVVAKYGNQPSSRASVAILESLGLGGLCAVRSADYIERAVLLAGDKELLTHLRKGMRKLILSSGAGEPEAYRLAVEKAYREMWRIECCYRSPPTSSATPPPIK